MKMADLTLTLPSVTADTILGIMSEGSIDEMPVGPISTLVPQKYHKYLDADTLKSLLVSSSEVANRLTDSAALASLRIICKKAVFEVYPKVLGSLNNIGREAVQEINPWVLNTLVDWCDFDNVICSSIPDTHSNKSSDSSSCEEKSTNCKETPEAPSDSDKWSTEATHYLLSLYKDNLRRFKSPFYKKKAVWKQISDLMEKEGFPFDPIKCERKILNLKAKFKKVKVYNEKSGNEPKSCPFYDQLNEIFHKDPSIIPLSTCSNLIKQREEKKPAEISTAQEPKKTKIVEASTAEQPKKKQKKSDVIISLLEKQQERDQERTALLMEMRDQQREQTNRFLNIFEKALCGKSDENNNIKGCGSD